jgi:V8-like Glu-specific endopeptidase
MRRAARFHVAIPAVFLLGLVACSDAPVLLDEGGERTPQVVNGTVHNGHPAVGLLYVTDGNQGALCTATLVGSQTVLTAAHCTVMEKSPPYTKFPKMEFYINGQWPAGGSLTGTKYNVISATYHPGYNSAGVPVADVAVLRLASPVQGVQPMRVAPNPTYAGEQVRFVGYGKTGNDNNDSGVKRTAVNTVEQLAGHYFTYVGAQGSEGNTCSGDSGSSVFATRSGEEVIVGIHSAGTCALGDNAFDITGYSMRADTYYGWIEQTAQGDLYKGSTGGGSNPGPTGPTDTGAPTVAILSPANNAQVGPSFLVNASAKDDTGVKLVRLLVDGQPVGQTNAPPYQFQVQNQPTGQHQLRIEAMDNAGKTGSASVNVTVTTSAQPPAQPPSEPPPTEPPASPPATPPVTRGYGEPCAGGQDCQSNLCALDPVTGATFCTKACSLDYDSCPTGNVCHPTGAVPICGPSHDGPGASDDGSMAQIQGACAFAPATSTAAPLPLSLLALLGLLALRRR